MTATKVRLERLRDEAATIDKLHEDLVAHAESRDDPEFTEVEAQQISGYRERKATVLGEMTELVDVLKREEESARTSKIVREQLAWRAPGVSLDGGEVRYRSFAAYARDELIVRYDAIAERAGGADVRERARDRLHRAPQHTTSDDVEGLMPPQHLTQILEVIDATRPVVATANRSTLERGQLTFPHIDQKPEVLLQATEKTEGGTRDMQIGMETIQAQTFIGGGNLSWQAIEWSTPSALELWFRLAGEQYARKTEGTACAVLTACGTANRVGTGDRIGTASTFADWLGGIVAGFAEVYGNSGALADTLWVSPDMFFLAAALTSDAGAVLVQNGGLNLAGLAGNIAGVRVVTSYGFGTATAIVGDSSAFIVAETGNAPVQLRAVEPSIGGMEVGVIGAFAAACYDDNRFAAIT